MIATLDELVLENEEKEKRLIELTKANAELTATNKELESFSYVSSHDLQEPLRKIQSFAGLILTLGDQTLSKKGREYLDAIQSAVSRMRQLIDELLAFSRIRVDERTFDVVDLNGLVDEVKNELKETLEEKNVTIETSQLCKVRIIAFQFRQIIHNLISNALKFSRPGIAPFIRITSKIATGEEFGEVQLLQDKCYCHICISDNGIGFDPKYRDRIFEAFQRLHGKLEYAGSGIGLAIVKKVVENHNGFISATGSLNNGAAFNIYLPA